MLSPRTPIVLCIDVEPDRPFNPPTNPLPWEGYRCAVEFITALRPEFERMTSAPMHVSWFYRMDPQVEEMHGDPGWALTAYPVEAKTILAANDECGLHTHPFRWDRTRGAWIQDYGNQGWVEHSLHMAFAAFKSTLSRPCVSFRFGDRWMNNRTFRLLEGLGVRFDLTLEPGSKRLPSYHAGVPHSGFIPDQRRVPRAVYRPAKSNYQKPDPARTDGPHVIPISTAPIHLPSGTLYRRPTLAKWCYYRLIDGERIRSWTHALNIAAEPRVFRSILDYNLRIVATPYLAMVARAHVFSSPEFADNARANLRALFDGSATWRERSFEFVTPAEAVACLEDSGGCWPVRSR